MKQCPDCGLWRCTGECWDEQPEPEIEAVEQRPVYTRSAEYAAWIEGLGPSVGEVTPDPRMKKWAA